MLAAIATIASMALPPCGENVAAGGDGEGVRRGDGGGSENGVFGQLGGFLLACECVML